MAAPLAAVGTVALEGATRKAVQVGGEQIRNPESFLNQALKYLAIAVLILSILLGLYLVANWGFLKDGLEGLFDGTRLGRIIDIGIKNPFAGIGAVVAYLNPFRRGRFGGK